jgi:hypothetical protein
VQPLMTYAMAAASVAMCGCSTMAADLANTFVSNSYVAYAPPPEAKELNETIGSQGTMTPAYPVIYVGNGKKAKGSEAEKEIEALKNDGRVQTMLEAQAAAKATGAAAPTTGRDTQATSIGVEVGKGECIVVDYMGGYLHDTFAGWADKATAWMMRTKPQGKLSVAIRAVGHATGESPGVDQTLAFNNLGQLGGRGITGVTSARVAGPFKYPGDGLTLSVRVVEQDKEDYKAMVENVQKATGNAERAAKKLDTQAQAIAAAKALVKFTAVSPASAVLLGAEAANAVASLLQTIDGRDDLLMKESVRLGASSAKGVPSTVLRFGTYYFVRASTRQGEINALPCVKHSPQSTKLRASFGADCSKADAPPKNPWIDVLWIALAVRDADQALCSTGVPQGKGTITTSPAQAAENG